MSTAETVRKYHRVRSYLLKETVDGPIFVKSKFVAEDLGLSAREIGAALGRLADRSGRLDVERWSYTNATTWRVART